MMNKEAQLMLGTVRKYEQGERKIPAFMWRALRDLDAELGRPHPARRPPVPRSRMEGGGDERDL